MTATLPRPVAASVEELVGGAPVTPAEKSSDSLSGSRFERAVVDGRPCLIKHLCVDDDWIMRASGDLTVRQVELWRRGLFAMIPEEIDTTLLGVASWREPGGRTRAALLMRDVGDRLVPAGDAPISLDQEHRFLDHMALLHASLGGAAEVADVFPLSHHYTALGRAMVAVESARGTPGIPVAVASGWDRLADAAPRAHPLLEALGADPSPLVDALSRTPHTVVQGDWKLGNLGSHADGRTILIDWDRCGRSPHTVDLAWYLAVNCDRMPEPKEDAIAWYRAALERRGVDTGGWFEEQLALALLGGMLQLGWAKAGGNPEEIAWWEARALEAAPLLGSDSRKE